MGFLQLNIIMVHQSFGLRTGIQWEGVYKRKLKKIQILTIFKQLSGAKHSNNSRKLTQDLILTNRPKWL